MVAKTKCCATCRFFCQEIDPENRLYFDGKSGECRANPPADHFIWKKTRPYHWCGMWQAPENKELMWSKISMHTQDEHPVLLFRRGKFCKQAGMVVGYWNSGFKKWHDDGDQLIDHNEITDWMPLPDPPKY
jgi:Protein of unknown function (DUF551)